MKKIKTFCRKYSLLIKILLSYLVISVVLFSIFSFVLIKEYTKRSMKDVEKTTENMVFQSYNTMDILFSNTFAYFYDMAVNDIDIVSGLCNETFTSEEKLNIISKLSRAFLTQRYISSAYIYNKKADTIFSVESNGYKTMEKISNFYDKDIVQIIKNINKKYKGIFIARHSKYSFDGNNYDRSYISLILHMSKYGEEPNNALIVNFNQEDIQRTITNGKYGDQFQTFIINNDGIVISHAESSMINKNLSSINYIKEVLKNGEKAGSFTTQIKNDRFFVSYVKSESLGWTIVGVGEYNKLLIQTENVRKYMIIVTILFIFIAIIVAILFTNKIYSPIFKLVKEIRDKNEEQVREMNEYELLNWKFRNMIDNIQNLKKDIRNVATTKKKDILLQIINNEIQEGYDYENLFNKYNIKLISKYYLSIIIRIDNFQNLCMRNKSSDISLFKFAMLNIATEVIRKDYKVEGLENGIDYITLILNLDVSDMKMVKDKIKVIMTEIQQNIEKFLELSVSISIGNIASKLDDIHLSYKNALIASEYRLINGAKSIIFYDDIKNCIDEMHEYPYEQEVQIIKAIKSKSIKKVIVYIDEFFDELKVCNPNEILLYIIQLCIMITRSCRGLKEDQNDFNIEFRDLYEEITKHDTLEEIKRYIISMCNDIISNQIIENSCRKKEVANKIKDYIDANFSNPELTIYDMAEYVNLSTNYTRIVFKEIFNISPSDYLLELRINKAKELLKTTDLTAKNIAEKVGFSDSRYFYITFKKIVGKTAEEYRKENKT